MRFLFQNIVLEDTFPAVINQNFIVIFENTRLVSDLNIWCPKDHHTTSFKPTLGSELKQLYQEDHN